MWFICEITEYLNLFRYDNHSILFFWVKNNTYLYHENSVIQHELAFSEYIGIEY